MNKHHHDKHHKKHDDEEEHADEQSLEDIDDVSIEEEEFSGDDAVKKLRKRLKACMEERQEYMEGWQRMRADFANARKDNEKKQDEIRAHANEKLLLDLLPVLDSFDMAFSNAEAWEKVDKGWRDGVTYIHSQLVSTLEQYGVTLIDPQGQKFDHALHTSLEAVPTDDQAQDDVIAAVLQKGYRLHDKVIRPANVKVFVYKKGEPTD